MASPTGEGRIKLAKKTPLVFVGTEAGVVGMLLPLNFIVTVELGSNPAPAISTDLPTGPKDGLRKMIGFTKGVTLNVFEAELDP